MSESMCVKCKLTGEINEACEHPCVEPEPVEQSMEERVADLELCVGMMAPTLESLAASLKELTIRSVMLQKRLTIHEEEMRQLRAMGLLGGRYGMPL